MCRFLPVIPGPCGLFRMSDVTDTILARVRDIVTNPAERDSIVEANLKIAEDRILSYLLLFMGKCVPCFRLTLCLLHCHRCMIRYGGKQTHWVPDVLFFFESEDNIGEFVRQRRRWLNGTTAGYLWLVTNRDLWCHILLSHAPSAGFMAIKILFVALLQVHERI